MPKREHKPTVSDTVRDAIKKSGVSIYQLSGQSGIAYAVLWRFLSGERQLTTGTLDRLCDFLGYRLVKK
jgi:hypothetical protein